jgi:hypothetical protein
MPGRFHQKRLQTNALRLSYCLLSTEIDTEMCVGMQRKRELRPIELLMLASEHRHALYRASEAKELQCKADAALTVELRQRMHQPIRQTGPWLRAVLLGHYRYDGVPMSGRSPSGLRYHVLMLWRKTLKRHSQKNNRITCTYMDRLAKQWLPQPRIMHPYTNG